MTSRHVVVINTGSANLASVQAALVRTGLTPVITTEPAALATARAVVLPGVGAFGTTMDRLVTSGLRDPLRRWIDRGAPLLAICLGLQLLAESSEETPGVAGLGAIAGTVRCLPDTRRRPQMGWNLVEPRGASSPIQEGWAYFANSYALMTDPLGWDVAAVEYGGRSVAAISRGAQLACQFHPELSSAWGAQLLDRWSRQW